MFLGRHFQGPVGERRRHGDRDQDEVLRHRSGGFGHERPQDRIPLRRFGIRKPVRLKNFPFLLVALVRTRGPRVQNDLGSNHAAGIFFEAVFS